MKKAVLIDGNNLLFRSYYATAYNGNLMKNSKGFPTNALYGFINMINKILDEEKPEYVMVAFDKGKNFRHDKYKDYKAGRIKTPDDLLTQFPKAYEILDAMGIVTLDKENYEADDIIGTFAKMADLEKDFDALIVSSDKDLLQLISGDVTVKLLKQQGYILMDEKTFFDTYQTSPSRMIDLKALMGDSSDNIPGVKGIGEKTAINLISTYGSLEGVYNNLDKVSAKTKEKLETDRDNAFFSYELATIYKDIDLNLTFEDIKKKQMNTNKLVEIYKDLEFFSLLKGLEVKNEVKELDVNVVKERIEINNDFAYFLLLDEENYHKANIIGVSIYDGENAYYLDKESILLNKDIFKHAKYTYDYKKNIVALGKLGIKLNSDFDSMIASYLLNYNIKEDLAYLTRLKGTDTLFYDDIVKNKKVLIDNDKLIKDMALKAKTIYDIKDTLINELKDNEEYKLYIDIEHPLIKVLASMEEEGVLVDASVLDEIKEETEIKLNMLSSSIYNMVGEEFNIASPKQLGEILFEKLNLPHARKSGKNGYSTDHDTLVKLIDYHPVISKILEYRELSKIMSTYMDSLKKYIMEDNKIHTIYKQAVTRTGRLSSVEPNLQNIPIRSEEGKRIRKAFLPLDGSVIMSSDYSQIELRVLSHISEDDNMINAFISGEDIHSKVASDIYAVPLEAVTKEKRRNAKAVIFGIVYGISGFGLGENLRMNKKEADNLINKYLTMYPKVKEYMDKIVEVAKKDGYVKTLFGRIRVIDEIKNTNFMIRKQGERMALNTPIQGTSADIIKMAMIKVDEEIRKNNLKSRMIIQVHDELVFTVPKGELEQMNVLVTDVMENIYTLKVPLKVDVESGTNWYNAK